MLMTRSSPTTGHPSQLGSPPCREHSFGRGDDNCQSRVPGWPLLGVLGSDRLTLHQLKSPGQAPSGRP
ncbi:hypothetical protein TIFTF001_007569 [Ficus carica]|uniref:Uncharacterized protein n=1 Tax=Ficus carica TaxID=3494 RepID=A0AA87ZTI2_FICCA|nr:hypothetical protein TIFTF001_007569 [Ficus carica]